MGHCMGMNTGVQPLPYPTVNADVLAIPVPVLLCWPCGRGSSVYVGRDRGYGIGNPGWGCAEGRGQIVK